VARVVGRAPAADHAEPVGHAHGPLPSLSSRAQRPKVPTLSEGICFPPLAPTGHFERSKPTLFLPLSLLRKRRLAQREISLLFAFTALAPELPPHGEKEKGNQRGREQEFQQGQRPAPRIARLVLEFFLEARNGQRGHQAVAEECGTT
jgi:hypothetical protein